MSTLETAVKGLPTTEINANGHEVTTDYGKLLEGLTAVKKSVVEQAKEQIEGVQNDLTGMIQDVFRGYSVLFDARPEEDAQSCLNFFKPGAILKMGPTDGFKSAAEKQGSGARRTLMWAALKYAAEKKAGDALTRPNLLLMDEPELCLHPNAVREACKVLYDLPETGRWQVMVTTHSPAFIDLSRDNTTVVRVERGQDGQVITGTTVFRPGKAKLSEDEKEELKMLNLCDPHLCEFFFGGRTVIVEGDTEYTAFRYLLESCSDDHLFKDVHIVRARGKATICLVAKILNQFDAKYAVLHDSDHPKTQRRKKGSQELEEINNPAWTNNKKILDVVADGLSLKRIRLVASVPHFEGAFFGQEVSGDKPVNAWHTMKAKEDVCRKVKSLLYALLDSGQSVPAECCEWHEEAVLHERHEQYVNGQALF